MGSTRHFFQKGLIFLDSGKTGFFCKHVESILSIPYRGRVAHCSKLLHNVSYWQKNPNQATGLNPVAVNQFLIFFFIRFECSDSLSLLEILFILRSLFHLI